METRKLKPVTYNGGSKNSRNKPATFQQMLLLKALTVTQDPQKLRQMIGVRKVADVYRTLDKMAMRKEYHEALAANGISFDYLVGKLKSEIDEGHKASDRINAVKVLMKSVGMDKYEESAIAGGGWEDELLKINEGKMGSMEVKKIGDGKSVEAEILGVDENGDYEVVVPQAPEHVQVERALERKQGKSLYE